MFDPYAPYHPRTSQFWKLRNDARAVEVACQWPLPRIGGCDPRATVVADNARKTVEISYPDLELAAELFIPVFAAQRGDIAFAGETTSGYAITIDHGAWCSHYAHLSQMFVVPNLSRRRRLQHVRPGEIIGYATKNPLHIRFEIWERTFTQGFEPIDPHNKLTTWRIESPIALLRTPRTPAEAA